MWTRTAVYAGAVLLAGVAIARAESDHTRQQVATEREATQLVERINEVGQDVHHHAERLVSAAENTGISSWTHYHHLDAIKLLVNNDLRPALKRLITLQAQLPEWKQESVERMLSAAQELAADASSAFVTKASSRAVSPAMNTEYKAFVAAMTAHADNLVKTSDAAHTFAVAHVKAAEAGLSLPKQ